MDTPVTATGQTGSDVKHRNERIELGNVKRAKIVCLRQNASGTPNPKQEQLNQSKNKQTARGTTTTHAETKTLADTQNKKGKPNITAAEPRNTGVLLSRRLASVSRDQRRVCSPTSLFTSL